jgi:ribonuclease P protein component
MQHEMKFSKDFRLRSKRDFENLKSGSKRIATPLMALYFKNNQEELGRTRIGFSISRKVGCSVVRNRVKRLMREEFRVSASKYLAIDFNLVINPIVAKKFCNDLSSLEESLIQDFLVILKKLKHSNSN